MVVGLFKSFQVSARAIQLTLHLIDAYVMHGGTTQFVLSQCGLSYRGCGCRNLTGITFVVLFLLFALFGEVCRYPYDIASAGIFRTHNGLVYNYKLRAAVGIKIFGVDRLRCALALILEPVSIYSAADQKIDSGFSPGLRKFLIERFVALDR